MVIRKESSGLIGFIESTAIFSDDMRYRYVLTRRWNGRARGIVAFIGLNPSTATHEESDPTVNRCINFARREGFNGMTMLNIFALRSTDPRVLRSVDDPVGPENDHYIVQEVVKADMTVVCWGNHGNLLGRGREVYEQVNKKPPLKCFAVTKCGQPKHPLYLKSDMPLVDYMMED